MKPLIIFSALIALFCSCKQTKSPTHSESYKFYAAKMIATGDSLSDWMYDAQTRLDAGVPIDQNEYHRLMYNHMRFRDSAIKYTVPSLVNN